MYILLFLTDNAGPEFTGIFESFDNVNKFLLKSYQNETSPNCDDVAKASALFKFNLELIDYHGALDFMKDNDIKRPKFIYKIHGKAPPFENELYIILEY